MFEEVERVKERRRERLERIRTQARDSLAPYVNDWKDDDLFASGSSAPSLRHDQELLPSLPPQEKWGIQTFFSLLLIGCAYLIFQSGISLPLSWKAAAREVMTRDFNFAGAADWYEARFGRMPSVLPALSMKKPAVPAAAENQPLWRFPDNWKVVKSFDPASPRVVMDMGEEGKIVHTGGTGWVTFVGEKPGMGLTVTVRFPQARELWIGNLEESFVEQNEVLYKGAEIGSAKPSGQSSHHVIVAWKEKEKFVNPLEVIALD
jgi:stage IV sporulation protein FA